MECLTDLARPLGPAEQVRAADAWGPFPPWTRPYLEFRRDAYQAVHDSRAGTARDELEAFLRNSGIGFAESLLTPP